MTQSAIDERTIVDAILHQGDRRAAYFFRFRNGIISGEPKEVSITQSIYDGLRAELPVTYEEVGYVKFNIDEQLELCREHELWLQDDKDASQAHWAQFGSL